MTHHLVVQETRINLFADLEARGWWLLWRHRNDDRCTTTATTLVGETVHVACDDRHHAEQLADHMRAMGIPAAAITIRRAR